MRTHVGSELFALSWQPSTTIPDEPTLHAWEPGHKPLVSGWGSKHLINAWRQEWEKRRIAASVERGKLRLKPSDHAPAEVEAAAATASWEAAAVLATATTAYADSAAATPAAISTAVTAKIGTATATKTAAKA